MSERWKTSRELLKRASGALAGGVSSPFRAKFPVPLYFHDGQGSRLEDEDGNWYIDYTLAWGPVILGHKHPALVAAYRQAAERPLIYGAEHRLEIEVAERIQAMVPCAERVAFTSSGSEAVQLALRLARAHTGRPLILKFEGHYHGWFDSVLVSHHAKLDEMGAEEAARAVPESSGQVANALENVIPLPWNRLDLLERVMAERGDQVACVIMEPWLMNSGGIEPTEGYLRAVREVAHRHGAVLIFDEIITGFRMAPGGAQSVFGVTPDLATFGKAVGGGAPLSVVAGRKEILELMFGGGVSFGGTFNGNPVSLAAAAATLEILAADGGRALRETNERGRRLMEGMRAAAARRGVKMLVNGFGAAFALHFTNTTELKSYRDVCADDAERLRQCLFGLLERGVYALPDGRFYLSLAHTDADVEETLAAVDAVLAAI
ncbi:MAG: aspartate aminotransferase family protein [Acidobacteria bacterium]|nr:aspartate aminotransferase family protein [Acidobacteriota bacterium]